MEEIISLRNFNEINLQDPFFKSLIEDYPEFPEWFKRKGQSGADAYVQYKDNATLQAFLYMKDESDEVLADEFLRLKPPSGCRPTRVKT